MVSLATGTEVYTWTVNMDPFDDFDDIPNFDLGVIDEIQLLNMPIQSLVLPNERRRISAPPMIENNGRHVMVQ